MSAIKTATANAHGCIHGSTLVWAPSGKTCRRTQLQSHSGQSLPLHLSSIHELSRRCTIPTSPTRLYQPGTHNHRRSKCTSMGSCNRKRNSKYGRCLLSRPLDRSWSLKHIPDVSVHGQLQSQTCGLWPRRRHRALLCLLLPSRQHRWVGGWDDGGAVCELVLGRRRGGCGKKA